MRSYYQLLDWREPELVLERGELVILIRQWERDAGYWDDPPPRWRWLRAWLQTPEAAWIRELGDISGAE